jgi:hypothetical protein
VVTSTCGIVLTGYFYKFVRSCMNILFLIELKVKQSWCRKAHGGDFGQKEKEKEIS